MRRPPAASEDLKAFRAFVVAALVALRNAVELSKR